MSAERLALVGLLLALTGCPTRGHWGWQCTQACDRLYAPDQCSIGASDADRSDKHGRCVAQCESAWREDGEARGAYLAGDTGPETYRNEAEATQWMECVDETPCTELSAGACPPVF